MGPLNAGKSSLTRLMINYACRERVSQEPGAERMQPLFVDLDIGMRFHICFGLPSALAEPPSLIASTHMKTKTSPPPNKGEKRGKKQISTVASGLPLKGFCCCQEPFHEHCSCFPNHATTLSNPVWCTSPPLTTSCSFLKRNLFAEKRTERTVSR